MMAALSWRSSDRPNVDYSALTCTDSNSGLHREFPSDSIASSAVSLPLSNASLGLVIMWMGVRVSLLLPTGDHNFGPRIGWCRAADKSSS